MKAGASWPRRHWPVGTALLSGLAVAAWVSPDLQAAFLDVRELRPPSGVWRPLTGHLAHGSTWHLALNLALFLPLGWLRERRRGTLPFLLDYAWIAALVALGLRLLHGDWHSYCGLSGVVYGLLAAFFIERRLGWWVAALALKTGLELYQGGWLTGAGSLEGALGVVYLPGSHAAGLLGGALLGLVERWRPAVLKDCPAARSAA